MAEAINLNLRTPLRVEDVEKLKSGDKVLLSGEVYTARDAAHKRLIEALEKGESPPFALEGAVIYYVGPAPARPGEVIGPAGPTTSTRMDPYTPALLERGVKGLIGKGSRNKEVREALKKYKAVYFAATGGAAALTVERIKASQLIAYEDLGTEAIMKLTVEDFPVIVANDIYGHDLFAEGLKKYRRRIRL